MGKREDATFVSASSSLVVFHLASFLNLILFLQILFQTMSDVILILSSIGSIGFIISIVDTIFLLVKFNVLNTAWIYTVLASIAFFLAGLFEVILATNVVIVELSWATPLGLAGGYILILLAINQYLQDKRKIISRLSTFDNTETPVIEDVQ